MLSAISRKVLSLKSERDKYMTQEQTGVVGSREAEKESGEMNKVKPFFYDVTLRDGNQALRKPWNMEEKKRIFNLLVRLGVQGAEVGFPVASPMDYQCTQHLGQIAPDNMVIGALARANEEDIDFAVRALVKVQPKAIPRLHTFIGMSSYHMEHVLRKRPDQVRVMAVKAVQTAKDKLSGRGEIQFSPEHFGDCLDNLDWVIESLLSVVDAGATIINLPNTVERTKPDIFCHMVKKVVDCMPAQIVIAVHCHNDMGMATATTIKSFDIGASQLEVTLNGLGERAGNTSLYETAVVLWNNDVSVDINFEVIYEASLQIAEMSGIPIPMKAALIGPEVLKHRSGIHQSGAIRTGDQTKGAYRPIDPKLIGRAGDEECEFTSQSGAAAVGKIIRETGRTIIEEEANMLQPALKAVSEDRGVLTSEQLAAVHDALKALREKKPKLTAEDILAVTKDAIGIKSEPVWKLIRARADSDNINTSTATITLQKSGAHAITDAAVGDGPLDAAFQAIKRITGITAKVEDYSVKGVTPGSDAQGQAFVVLSHNGRECRGEGSDTDVIQASIKAFLNALNRLLAGEKNGSSISQLTDQPT